MKETIFYLEGRGGKYLYHFFILNLGGLYHILNKEYNIRQENTSVLLDDKTKIVNKPSNEITVPIKVYMKDILPFQRNAFKIIEKDVQLIENLDEIHDYEIVSIYGTSVRENVLGDDLMNILPFIRNIFLKNINYTTDSPKRRIFITRKNSETQHSGNLYRYIFNEDELIIMLEKYHFEFIQLEDYETEEKIKLFMESEIVVSSHSGGLTCSMFLDKNAKLIEIIKYGTHFEREYGRRENPNAHYLNIANILGHEYYRYSDIDEDYNGNFYLNINEFEKYLYYIINK